MLGWEQFRKLWAEMRKLFITIMVKALSSIIIFFSFLPHPDYEQFLKKQRNSFQLVVRLHFMDLVSTCLWCTNKKGQVRVSVLIKNKTWIMASGIRKNNITAGLRGLLHCWDPQKVCSYAYLWV